MATRWCCRSKSMVAILDLLKAELPNLRRVSAYANAHSLLRKTPEELREIREHGLEMLYLGLESGDEETLASMGKGVTVAEQIEGCRKVKEAGFKLSVMAILGLGGVERSLEHARGTGRALSAIDPDFISMLSLMLAQGAPLAESVARGEFVIPDALGILRELREIIAETNVTQAVFRTTHASNYLPLEGTLPADKPGCSRRSTTYWLWATGRHSDRSGAGVCRPFAPGRGRPLLAVRTGASAVVAPAVEFAVVLQTELDHVLGPAVDQTGTRATWASSSR